MLSSETSDLSQVFSPIAKRPRKARLWNSSFSLWTAAYTGHLAPRLWASASGLAAEGLRPLGEQCGPVVATFLSLRLLTMLLTIGSHCVFRGHKCDDCTYAQLRPLNNVLSSPPSVLREEKCCPRIHTATPAPAPLTRCVLCLGAGRASGYTQILDGACGSVFPTSSRLRPLLVPRSGPRVARPPCRRDRSSRPGAGRQAEVPGRGAPANVSTEAQSARKKHICRLHSALHVR